MTIKGNKQTSEKILWNISVLYSTVLISSGGCRQRGSVSNVGYQGMWEYSPNRVKSKGFPTLNFNYRFA